MRHRVQQFVNESVVYSTALLLRRATAMITIPVLTRYLAPAEFGMVAVIGTVRELLSVLYQLGLSNAADRFAFECEDERARRRLFGTLALFSLAATMTLSVALILGGPWLWRLVAPEIPFTPYISLTVIAIFLLNPGNLARSVFRVTDRVPRYAFLNAVHGLLVTALTLALVIGTPLGVSGVVFADAGAALVFFSSSLGV